MSEVVASSKPKNVDRASKGTRAFGGKYADADLGLENYWYPVGRSSNFPKLRSFLSILKELPYNLKHAQPFAAHRPKPIQILGHRIAIMRDQKSGKLHAFEDRCPHRGVPLNLGLQDWPGTVTCGYHGWVFSLEDGVCKAALTDGPDSPVCKNAGIKVYPVQEIKGYVFVWIGDAEPVPIEKDVPKDFLDPGYTVVGRFSVREGDWRMAAENGFDEGHFKYLHRPSRWTYFKNFPAFNDTKVIPHPDDGDEGWITRVMSNIHFQGDYPGLGVWPKKHWAKKLSEPVQVSIKLPGLLRVTFFRSYVNHKPVNDYEWFMPTKSGCHLYFQALVKPYKHGSLRGLIYKSVYWLYMRWMWHGEFNNGDARYVEQLPVTAPEKLYRPDVSIIGWRRLVERDDRAKTT